MEQELLTFRNSAVGFMLFNPWYSVLWLEDHCLFFLLVTALFVVRRHASSDYPFGIFKLSQDTERILNHHCYIYPIICMLFFSQYYILFINGNNLTIYKYK